MSESVIKIKGVSKRYRVGTYERADTFAQNLQNLLLYPIKNWRQIKKMVDFTEDDASVFWALNDINLEVNRGEVVGIIGHNGAGKSTLLKILSRITEPTSGRVEIKGRISALLEVGTGFHPELTGRDNIYMNGTILGMRKGEIKKKFEQIVSFAGVHKHIDTPVKFYSSGMVVRLAFSVAAHLEPEILIIDEVLAVGDAEFQKKCLGKMEDVASSGRTVLFVSHNMGAISNLCSRAVLLKEGRIHKIGQTDDVIGNYVNDVQSQEKIDIKKYKRERSSDVVIEDVELYQGSKKKSSTNVGEPFTLRVSVNSITEVKGVLIAIKIKTLDRVVITMINSIDQERSYDIQAGMNEIFVTIDNHFMAGKYLLDVGVNASLSSKAFDVVLDYPLLEFNNVGKEALTFKTDRPGLVYPKKVNWD